MMTKIDMSEMRATIFAPPIFYNTENLKKLLSVLPEEDSFTPRTLLRLHPNYQTHLRQYRDWETGYIFRKQMCFWYR